MDQNLLRSYFATVYELASDEGPLRVSIDGEPVDDVGVLPALLRQHFAIITAYNPRSMLLPRRVNEMRQQVLRDLLVLGNHRVEQCVGHDQEPDVGLREPAWLVHAIDREEAIAFGRTFRQNTVVFCQDARPELIVTDPTCDPLGKTYRGHWRIARAV